ncbi:hypothetical protein PC116_g33133 [Phytophthora cactorum]|nr:hypothetical protein PC116_g33133 [Phytophthora cactorum]
MQNGYAAQPVMNGASGALKRGRDDEDDLPRPSSGGLDLKRRKTVIDGPIAPGYDAMSRPASAVARRR